MEARQATLASCMAMDDAADAVVVPAGELSLPPPELVMVARAVQRLVARNDAAVGAAADGCRGGGGGEPAAPFEAARGAPAPRIGVAQYLERVHRYAGLEAECYVVAYAYVDMVAHRRPAAAVASRNVHRLLLACLLVASKVLDDFHHNNAFFARVGGVSNAEMNKLELELLDTLDFEVMVSHRVYGLYHAHLQQEMQRDATAGGGGSLVGAAGANKARTAVAPKLTESSPVGGGGGDRRPPPNGVHGWTQHVSAANGAARRHSSSMLRSSSDRAMDVAS